MVFVRLVEKKQASHIRMKLIYLHSQRQPTLRKRSLAHVCEFPTVSLDGNYPPIGTEGVRVGRDGMARNGVVAVGFVHDEHPEVPSMPHSGIANTLVDFEDDRGRCPGDPR